jgi:hypothetical protein
LYGGRYFLYDVFPNRNITDKSVDSIVSFQSRNRAIFLKKEISSCTLEGNCDILNEKNGRNKSCL